MPQHIEQQEREVNGSHMPAIVRKMKEAVDDTSFDVSNYNETQVKNILSLAFAQPDPRRDNARRVNLVCGQGKSKDHAKACCEALITLGYHEDPAQMEVEGTFTVWHDVHYNKKLVKVYPKVQRSQAPEVQIQVPREVLLCLEIPSDNFHAFLNDKVFSFTLKRRLMAQLLDLHNRLKGIEAVMKKGGQVSNTDRNLYETFCMEKLRQRGNEVERGMKEHIQLGFLSRKEKGERLKKLCERKVNEGNEDLQERILATSAVIPTTYLLPDNKKVQLQNLWRQQNELSAKLGNGKPCKSSDKVKRSEVQGRLEELRKRLKTICEDCRGLNETDEELADRVKDSQRLWV